MSKNVKTFPLRLNTKYSALIDRAVFYTRAESKHGYIMQAIQEKMERDNLKHPEILPVTNEVV